MNLRECNLLQVSPDEASTSLQGVADKRRGKAVVAEKLQHAGLLITTERLQYLTQPLPSNLCDLWLVGEQREEICLEGHLLKHRHPLLPSLLLCIHLPGGDTQTE